MKLPLKLVKKIVVSFLSATFVLVFSGLVMHLRVPTIKADNITVYKNQVSSNSPLTMQFNGLMNRSSVQGHFSLFPEVRGTFDWTLNKLTFTPEERLKVGESYTLSITKDAQNILGKNLPEDYEVHFLVVDPPKVALAVPINNTEVDSKITVMFDRPLVALTTLDELNKKPIPLTISPSVKGTGKWLGTSAFQFAPDTRFDYSTTYTATVPAGVKTLDEGVLENPYTFTFTTPKVEFVGDFPEVITSTDPVVLPFSQEVNLDSVREHVSVRTNENDTSFKAKYQVRKEDYADTDGSHKTREIEDKKVVEISPESGSWGYDNKLNFEVKAGISGLEGTLSTVSAKAVTIATGKFVASTPDDLNDARYTPLGSYMFQFGEPVDIDSVIQNFWTQPQVSFNFVYAKKCDPNWEPEKSPDEQCTQITDETVVFATPQAPLENLKKYEGTFNAALKAKNGNSYLKNDYKFSFTTADVVKVLRTGAAIRDGQYDETYPKTYKNICIYSPTEFSVGEDSDKQFEFSPAIKQKMYFQSYNLVSSNYGPCKSSKNDRFALLVTAFMNPSSTYKITLKAGTPDTFGQKLAQDYSFTWKTESLDEHDVSLEIVQPNFYAFITPDQNAQPVFAAKNLNNYTIEACRLAPETFLSIDSEFARNGSDYKRESQLGWKGFVPSTEKCTQFVTQQVNNPPVFWERQYLDFDLRKLFGKQPTEQLDVGYYYVRAVSPLLAKFEYRYDEGRGSYRERVAYSPGQAIAVTNMHLAMKTSDNGVLFWATNLATGEALNNVSISLFDRMGNPVNKQGVTGTDGIVNIDLNKLPFVYAVAKYGNDSVVVSVDWNQGIEAYQFGINGGYPGSETKHINTFLYTDRPIYQPGHTVHFKGIVRDDYDVRLSVPAGVKKVSVTVKDNDYATIMKKDVPLSAMGTFTGDVTLADSVPLGQYTIESCIYPKSSSGNSTDSSSNYEYCSNGLGSSQFYVEEYKKPEYKLDVAFGSDTYVNGDTMYANVLGSYYFGAPVPNAKLNWALRSQNYYFDTYKGDWYSFSDYSTVSQCYSGCPYNDVSISSGETLLDSLGKATISQKLDLSGKDANGVVKPADTSEMYTLDATVTDTSNKSVSKSSSFIVHRGEFYLGVKTADYLVNAGDRVTAKIITVDKNGEPVSGKSVKVEVLKQNWKYVKKKNVDGGFYWDNERTTENIDDDTVTTDGDGRAEFSTKVSAGGEYVVKTTATDSRNNEFSSSMDFYVTTGDDVTWKQDNNNRIELKLDKNSYNVGDVAHVLVKTPYKNVKALVTYERAEIMQHRIVDVTSNAQVVDVPITEKMVPNFYVSVLVFKPGNADSLPDFKLGYIDVPVDTATKKLNIEIAPDKQLYAPGSSVKLTLTTKDSSGKVVPAEVSIAVVDESLLALKGNPKKDLLKAFYDMRMLSISTVDNLTNLLQRVNVNDLKGAKGGSGKGIDESLKPRGKFEDTALWMGQVTTDKDGIATTEFKLPDNLTTWNIEVVGVTKNSLVGVSQTSVIAQKQVMIRPLSPRFVAYGDELELGGIIHNYTPETQTLAVTIKADGLVNTDKETQKISLDSGKSQNVIWKVKVPYGDAVSSNAHITITAAGSVSASDAVEWDLPIRQTVTPEAVATSSYTDDLSFTEKVVVPNTAKPLAGSLSITTGATLATYVSSALNYLVQYPYGCSEQLISSVVPMVNLKQALNLVNAQDQLKLAKMYDDKGHEIPFDTAVSKTIQRIYAAQRTDGGFGYFSESSESYPYLSAYVLHGLSQLQKAGYAVDSSVLSRLKSYVVSSLRSSKDMFTGADGKLVKTRYWAANRAYMLFVLSEVASGDLALSNSLYADKDLLSPSGKAYLVMALKKLGGQSTKIDTLMVDLENSARIDARGTYIRSEDYSGSSMMTNVKTTAISLQAFTRINPNSPLVPRIIKWLIGARVDGHWATTQETSAALAAMTEYMKSTGEAKSQYSAKVALNGADIESYNVDLKNILDQKSVTKMLKDLKIGDAGNSVVFSKDGTGRLYYDLVLKYVLPAENIAPRSEGFVIQRSYYRMEDEKMLNPISDAKTGENLRAKLTVIVPEDRTAVAVEAPVPAGMEIVNFDLDTANKSLSYTYEKGQLVLPTPPTEPCSNLFGDGIGPGPCVNGGGFGDPNVETQSDGYFMGFAGYWTHKEVRDDRLALFADSLPKGVYQYNYFVQVTTAGSFINPPAVVSELYFPENFARTEGGKFEVKN